MKLGTFVRTGQWAPVAGYALYVVSLTAGYYYVLSFIQLGLTDLALRRAGLSPTAVAVSMGVFGLFTTASAVITGVVLDRRGWGTALYVKFRLLFLVLSGQLVLTVTASFVRTETAFLLWLLVCSLTLGPAIPVAFSLMLDLIPVGDRGYVAAFVAGGAFFFAATVPLDWQFDAFVGTATVVLVPAVFVFGLLSLKRTAVIDTLATQHEQATFGVGRFCRPVPVRTMSAAFWVPVAVLFGAFFVDSLGFIRLLEEPAYVSTSWQSPEPTVRLFIAFGHVLSAAVAGFLYTNVGRNAVFVGLFGLFAVTHLLYGLDTRGRLVGVPDIALPLLYAAAVSFYTTLNFALWPDLSTTDTIGTHTAIGVGIAGWLATFFATAVALYADGVGLPFGTHLAYVNGLSVLFLAVVVLLSITSLRSVGTGY